MSGLVITICPALRIALRALETAQADVRFRDTDTSTAALDTWLRAEGLLSSANLDLRMCDRLLTSVGVDVLIGETLPIWGQGGEKPTHFGRLGERPTHFGRMGEKPTHFGRVSH